MTVSASACIKLPDDIDLNVAVLAEPLAVSLRVAERAGSLSGKKVAVMGAGMIGLGVAHFASAANARVWIFGKEQDEAKFKISKCLGADGSVNVDRDCLTAAWKKITNKEGFDVVFDCTGVSALIQECLNLTKIAGKVVASGIYPAPVQINLRDMVRQEKNLITSYGYTRSIFEDVLGKLRESPSFYENLITHTFKLEDGLEAVDLAAKGIAGKVILHP
jgi:threonine dehydrogenase-like Zn-dependent dehydrogenase